MPRNSNGVYTLPQAPFVPGTVISSAAVNSDLTDIATALTGSVASNGVTPITGQLTSNVTTIPAYSSTTDGSTGFGVFAPSVAAIWAGGAVQVSVSTTGITFNQPTTINGNLTVTGALSASTIAFTGAAIQIPSGTTGGRPGTPLQGDIRYNTSLGNFEGYDGSEWQVMSNITRNYALTASVNSGLLTINVLNALTNAAPTTADPIAMTFRSPNIGNGTQATVLISGALSINTNGIGATLGTANGTPFRFWIIAFNNNGTVELGLTNCVSLTANTVFPLLDDQLQNGVPISSAATSAGIIYSPNGVTIANAAIKILGYLEYDSGLATAGNYTTTPSKLALFGPGTKKPGGTIQMIYAQTSSQTSTASTSPQSSALSSTITPTSPANLVLAQGYASGNTASVNTQLTTQLARGATTIGYQGFVGGAPATIYGQCPINVLDAPGVSTATVYTLKFWTSTGGNFVAVLGGSLTLSEIMG